MCERRTAAVISRTARGKGPQAVLTVWPDDLDWLLRLQRVAGAHLVAGENSNVVLVLLLAATGRSVAVKT